MPTDDKNLRRNADALLRSALLKRGLLIPQSPAELAAAEQAVSDAPLTGPRGIPSLLFSWQRKDEAAAIVAFRSEIDEPPLAYAARADEPVSEETRKKLARLVREMERDPSSRDD